MPTQIFADAGDPLHQLRIGRQDATLVMYMVFQPDPDVPGSKRPTNLQLDY